MDLRKSLSSFLPFNILSLIKDKKRFVNKSGGLIFADLAGFTKLTDSLSLIGKEGAEELTRILNNFFENMINVIFDSEGDVVRFGGDAVTAFFENSLDNAIKASLLMQRECLKFEKVETRGGQFSLGMKVGISFGEVVFGIVGEKNTGYDYFCGGETLNRSAEGEHNAKRGEVVLSPECLNYLDKENYKFEVLENNFIVVKDFQKDFSFQKVETIKENLPDEDDLINFLPSYIKERCLFEEQKLVGEHRRTAVLFLKFSDFDFSREENLGKLDKIYIEVSRCVKKYGGSVNKVDMGDKGNKILCLFGSPYSLENQEEMAVRCALELIENQNLKELADWIKIGITVSNLFSAYIGSTRRREYTVMGSGINLSARLMTCNLDKSVIVDGEIYDKTKDIFEYKVYEPIEVKGKVGKVKVFAPIKVKEKVAKSSPFVGRRKEIEKILTLVLDEKGDRYFCITGPPGIGKSSLINKVIEELKKKEYKVYETKLALYNKEKPDTVIKNCLVQMLKLNLNDPKEIQSKIVGALIGEDKNYLPLFKDIFKLEVEENAFTQGLKGKERKDTFFAIVTRIIVPILSEEKSVIFVDHLEYADPSTLEFLSFFRDEIGETKSKLIYTLREDNLKELNEIVERSSILKVPPLNEEDVELYLTEVENFISPPDTLVEFLLKKSYGNPKFLSELVSILKSQNLAYIGRFDRYEVDEDKLSTATFPETLQSLFLSRVESLPFEEKNLVCCASVLGTSFSIETLCQLVEKDRDWVISKIKELEKQGIVKMDTWGKREYASFEDNLLREAVYDSLNYEFRRELHQKIGEYLENEPQDSPRVIPVLARHFELADVEEKSFHYLLESAKYSKSNYDYKSSYDFLFRYISLANKKGVTFQTREDFLEAFFMFADVLQELGRISEAGECYQKILEEVKDLSPTRVRALSKMADNKRREGKLKESLDLYEGALEGAKELRDESLQCRIFLDSGVTLAMMGRMGKAMDYFQRAEILSERLKDYPSLVYSLMNRGLVEYFRGGLEGAKSFLLRAGNVAKERNLRSYLALINTNLSMALFDMGNYSEALEVCNETIEVSRQFGFRNHLIMAMCEKALFETMLGKWDDAKKSVEKSLNLAEHYKMEYLIATSIHIKSLLLFNEGNFSESFKNQIFALKSFIENNHLGEALGSLSELVSLTNFLNCPELSSSIIEESLPKLTKELENTTKTWTIGFNSNYVFHKFLKGDLDFYDSEEKLENILDKARECGILWLVADVGNILIRLYQKEGKHSKCCEIGEELFPLLSTHFCPLILPRFLLNYSNSLLIEGRGDELVNVLKNLKNYDKILDRGPISAQYDYLLYKILKDKDKDEAQRRLNWAREIIENILKNEKDEIFRSDFLKCDFVEEILEK
jgi:class 3 adenylate cyclase/predicted ATPase